jgi:ubiquinone/menaquinone biosynthesis C-methylase UbiE
MNPKLIALLRSPEDGTSIDENLKSEGGIQYEMTDSGILLLDSKVSKPMDEVYSHPDFQKWEDILDERLQYYTEGKTVATKMSQMSYTGIKQFNKRGSDDFVLDIGCGDGVQADLLEDTSTYIGIDRNLKRLEMLKKRHPDATLIYADATNLPFKNGTIKHVFSSNCFEHLWYLKEVVKECYRITHGTNGSMCIVVPTEGGLWNLGRRVYSKPHFTKKYPNIDFELISHIEHTNNAKQIMRTLETFFDINKKYIPTRLPSIYLNPIVQIDCDAKNYKGNWFLN